MIDLSDTIEAKSDQLNGDDLLGGPRILEITNVKKVASIEQPILIYYKNDNGRPYKPSKGFRKILILGWGKNGEDYIGRKIEVYNDPTVLWAGKPDGGIRISKMSDLKQEVNTMLVLGRGRRIPYKVLKIEPEIKYPLTDKDYEEFQIELDNAETMADLQVIRESIKAGQYDDAGNRRIGVVYNSAKDRINKT